MAERLGARSRPIGMRIRPARSMLLGAVLALPLALAGCGDDQSTAPEVTSSPDRTDVCIRGSDVPGAGTMIDLDGDGTSDRVEIADFTDCPDALVAEVGNDRALARLDEDVPVTAEDLQAVSLPDRAGQVLLVTPQHPRGGFQARLYGYADGKLEELKPVGRPLFPFVATDVLSSPLAATCTADGFAITEARAHQPVGVAPAWDVYRTTYTVDGNTLTKGAESEVAENVLTQDLEAKYPNLVNHALFEDCLATG